MRGFSVAFPGLGLLILLALLLGLALPATGLAQTALPALTSDINPDGSQTWSLTIQTLVLLTMMSVLPAMLMMMTGFTRIIIVLRLLRNARRPAASPPRAVS